MITQTRMSENDLVVTQADFDRLEDLAESPKYRFSHSILLMTLKKELDRSKVVGPAEVSSGVVTMRSRVRFQDLNTRESETYTLVYPGEADIDEGKLSVLAPLGTALLGTRVGQIVRFGAPGGVRRLRIQKILYQPEAAGDYHL